jgi:glutamate 5-kinase
MNESSPKSEYQIHSAQEIPWKLVKKAKRIVIKIGTRALVDNKRQFDQVLFKQLSEDIQKLFLEGKEIIIVSSGAVNAGLNFLGFTERPREMTKLQVLAAVGNPLLMAEYQKHFHFCKIAQILVSQEDFSNRVSYNNFRNTLDEMVHMHIIPIINENDVVSVNELAYEGVEFNFTDNDILAGLVAASSSADLLVIFSDVDGLYTKHPNSPYAEFIPFVPEINAQVLKMGKSGSKEGRGGMVSKLIAANMITKTGGSAIVAHAKNSRLKDVLQGNTKLTFFAPNETLTKKQLWIYFGANLKGKIFIDEGAKQAIFDGASLLFQGIKEIQGNFKEDDVVGIYGPKEKDPSKNIKEEEYEMIARARINFSRDSLDRYNNMTKEDRKQYFKQNKIREIITHDEMAFSNF